MINEIFYMNGYGAYVWSSFIFTLSGFFILYSVIKLQLVKEQKKFDEKFKNLSSEKVELVKKQKTYRELLPNTSISKI
jgi:heme exporter protein D